MKGIKMKGVMMEGVSMKGVMIKKVLFLMIAAGLVFLAGAALAEDSASGEEILHIRPGMIHYSKDRIEFSGGVEIFKGEGETTVRAERGLYFSDTNRADLTGNVKVEYGEGRVSADKLEARLDLDEYLFRENVLLISSSEQDEELELRAPYLKLFLKDNSFQAREGVDIIYDQRILQGDSADYNDLEQTLELSGSVYIEEENGDWIKGEKALFNLETEEFTVEGGVELEVRIKSVDSEEGQQDQ